MFPVHADAAIEMAASLVRPHARLIVASNSQVPSMPVSPELARAIASEGATVVSGRRQVLSAMKSVDVAILGVPRQVEEFERVVHGGVWRVPFVVRHGFNAFDELAVLGVPGFMSPSASAVGTMSSRLPSCRTFQSRKVVSPRSIRQGFEPAGSREGFFSYINDYDAWPEEKSKFDKIAAAFSGRNGTRPQNVGAGSKSGRVNDMQLMPWARGTIHLKGGHACCNAVVRSLSVGTPVIMDSSTRTKCFFDSINGMIVRDSIDEIVRELDKLDRDDDHMGKAIESARAAARQFSYDDAYGAALASWLGGIKA